MDDARGFVVCPKCKLPNPVGPPACWSCGTALPAPVNQPLPPSAPAAATPGTADAEGRFAYGARESTASPEFAYPVSSGSVDASYTARHPPEHDRVLYVGIVVAGVVLVACVAAIVVLGH